MFPRSDEQLHAERFVDLTDVWRAANALIGMFGEDAAIKAALQADAALDVGSMDDYYFWKRVVVSIDDLNREPTADDLKN